MRQTVLVLGANGRVGRALVEAFHAAGWQVKAQMRKAPTAPLPAGVEAVSCDALDTPALVAAAQGAAVIVNALNPDYARWDVLLPPLAASVLAAARASRATLMLPGNVYNFGAKLPAVLTETTPEQPDTPKARQRIALEGQMRAASREGVRSIVIRAGDFFGGGPGSWFDMVIAKDIAKGRVTWPGPEDLPHAWAYLPDLARVFVMVAERRAALAPFESLHFAGHTLSGAQMRQALEQASGRSLELRQMSWWPLRLASPFVPMLRALLQMRYLWLRPHQLDDSRLRALLGTVPHTPLVAALAASLGRHGSQLETAAAGAH
ncbi:SDR family oxidoreductase [Niveibacterium umoris]|uniref:Nucleoside-diphosphate-sugar epimerase n=1 Tax=Niveibacterium umoris TaxID=1193620 RepID=A0A840BGC2_9RHOO|nr:NAD-dependent epimerase/dehydratase family protein [Niveibacterium umoris]MBB4012591.1 nucleoside-diphosphate-sugar epimerase [Niveibacterium umoris]